MSQPGPQALLERRRTEEPPNAEAGEQAFASLLTPASLRFVRCHHPVPHIGPGHDCVSPRPSSRGSERW